jgi:hypothetical protein
LWARFGTPTPRAESGSEEEFERAYARHTSDPGCVRVMVYFKKTPTDIDRIDPRQLEATRAFRSKLGPKGVLYWDFDTREDLQSHVRIHLSRQVHDWGKTWGTNSQVIASNEAPRVTQDAPAEEGLLDLIERGSGEFQIASEAVERITKLHEQIGSRTDGKARQLNALGSLPEKDRSKLGKLICNSIAVDLEQFAKGISGEAEVFHRHFLSGVEAFSKSFTYTEFYSIETIRAGEPQFNESLSGFSTQMEQFEHSMLALQGAIGTLPRITTQFNRAKAAAVAAIDEWRRHAASAMDWVRELKRNLEALKLRFAEENLAPPKPPQTPQTASHTTAPKTPEPQDRISSSSGE